MTIEPLLNSNNAADIPLYGVFRLLIDSAVVAGIETPQSAHGL